MNLNSPDALNAWFSNPGGPRRTKVQTNPARRPRPSHPVAPELPEGRTQRIGALEQSLSRPRTSHRIRPRPTLAHRSLGRSPSLEALEGRTLLSGVIELSMLDGSTGFALNGVAPGDQDIHPFRLANGAGDINGDGYADVILGATLADPGGRDQAGEAYLVFGGPSGGPAARGLSALDGTGGFIFRGVDPSNRTGNSVGGAGDVNGDGIDDLIIGAHRANVNGRRGEALGASYVVFGGAANLAALDRADGVSDGRIELSRLLSENGGNGSHGFVINGINYGDESGWSVAGAGDVNGDGVDDLIIGARTASPGGRTNAGASYVVFGRRGGLGATFELSRLLPANGGNGTEGVILRGIKAGDLTGWSAAGAGDVNGDGVDDLIIGALRAAPDGRTSAGESYVVFGRRGGLGATFELSRLLPANGGNGTEGVILRGINAYDESGVSVAGAGDVNGDGYADVIIGSAGARDGAGQAYLVYGRGAGSVSIIELVSLESLDGSRGLIFDGINPLDRAGTSVHGGGDVNGDGIDDLIIGASMADPDGRDKAGTSYVVFGGAANLAALDTADGAANGRIALSSLRDGDGSAGFALNGVAPEERSGLSASLAGDLNGDGIADLIIAAPSAAPNGAYSGRFYVVYGKPSVPTPGFKVVPSAGLVTTESGGQADFTVALATRPTADVTITVRSSHMAEGIVSTSSLTFTPLNWDQPQAVTVTGIDDAILDGDVAYIIVLRAATSADPAYQGLDPRDVSVTNRDDEVGLSIGDVRAVEGNSGSTAFVFTVTRSGDTSRAVTVSYATANGTAAAGSDYAAASGALNFAAGETSRTVTVTVYGDRTLEADETFAVNLSVASAGLVVVKGQGVGTIVNDDTKKLIAATTAAPATRPAPISPQVLGPLVDAALALWRGAGADVSGLAGLQVRVDDLPADELGWADGTTITLDRDAAGWGWFVDRSPFDSREFHHPGRGPASRRIDLLSALVHEVGHLLGHDHDGHGVMAETLAPGERLLPADRGDVDGTESGPEHPLAALPRASSRLSLRAFWGRGRRARATARG